jgi:hypothetical protein
MRCGVSDEGNMSFDEAAQVYEDKVDRQAPIQFLRDQLDIYGQEPQLAHRLIAGLTDCNVLITTCLDQRLERAFKEDGRPLNVIVGNADVPFGDERKARLYKLRGSIEQPGSLVLTEDDYEFFFSDQVSISVVLRGYLARKTILFVGYDLADHNFKRLYCEAIAPLDDYARLTYAFGETPLPRVRRWCERHNVKVVEADATVFPEALVEQLATRARPTPTAVPQQPPEALSTLLPEHPYKLLDYYEAKDAPIFFGRQQETWTISSLIHAHRLVLLHGASGTGKTSLLLAGAVPRLECADPPYEMLYVRALENPVPVIRRALRRRLSKSKLLTNLLTDGSFVDFVDAVTKILGCTLVIVLDQFEKLFIRPSPEFRAVFIAELGTLYDTRDVPVKVVLSLREDWLASMSEIERRIPDQISDGPFSIFLLIIVLTGVLVFFFVLEHMIENTSNFVSSSRDCLGSAVFSPHSAVECTQSAVTTTDTLSRHSKSLSSSVFRFHGPTFQDLTAKYVVVGSQEVKCLTVGQQFISTPVSVMIFWIPKGIQTVDLGQINTRNLVEVRAQIKLRCIA